MNILFTAISNLIDTIKIKILLSFYHDPIFSIILTLVALYVILNFIFTNTTNKKEG